MVELGTSGHSLGHSCLNWSHQGWSWVDALGYPYASSSCSHHWLEGRISDGFWGNET